MPLGARVLMVATGVAALVGARAAWRDAERGSREARDHHPRVFGWILTTSTYKAAAGVIALGGVLFISLGFIA